MAPSTSTKNLNKYLERGTFIDSARLFVGDENLVLKTTNPKTWPTIFCNLTKFCSDSTNPTLNLSITRLEDLASEIEDSSAGQKMEHEFFNVFHNSFLSELQKFLSGPKSDGDRAAVSRELLAGLVHFLLQILDSEEDGIGNVSDLHKDLTFLLAVLGDVPLFGSGELHEDVRNLLNEFQEVANDVGAFIYSSAITSTPANVQLSIFTTEALKFSLDLGVLARKMELLNAKIKEHCLRYAHRSSCIAPNSSTSGGAIDSFFILDNLIGDVLENLMMGQRLLEFGGGDDVKDKIKTLVLELISARSFLQDTEAHEDTETDELKQCRIQIRDTACEVEYLIDSFVVGNVPVWYLNLKISHVLEKFKIIGGVGFPKIKENITKVVKDQFSSPAQNHAATTFSKADDVFVGLENERMKILEKLSGGSKNLQIIHICGMPGLGKTTLAMKLYGQRSVVEYLDKRAWCVASQTYHRRKVLIDIVTSLSGELNKDEILRTDDESLALKIHQSLMGRRYLIVMDDIWNQDVWDDLRRFFPDDGNGSRIMFTSRIIDTAPSGSSIHKLPFLSKDQSWELLVKKVFYKDVCPQELQDVGKRIAASCDGLPLGVVVVAGILANMEKTSVVWQDVERSLHSYIYSDSSNCMNILELSYSHLPCHLKRCFLYFGALKRLWLAEGFVKKQGERSPEDIAEEYLTDLIGRNLVLIGDYRSSGGIKTCSIHDLLREMCLRKDDEENFVKIIEKPPSAYERHHRLCIFSESLAFSRTFGLHCRSFMAHLSDPMSCFSQMKLLKILHLLSCSGPDRYTIELKRIHLLALLRYLVIDQMLDPTALASLVNLEILYVYGRETTHKLSSAILKMAKLRHLHLREDAEFEED